MARNWVDDGSTAFEGVYVRIPADSRLLLMLTRVTMLSRMPDLWTIASSIVITPHPARWRGCAECRLQVSQEVRSRGKGKEWA